MDTQRGNKMADITETIRIDSRNNLHLSPSFLSMLKLRAGDSVIMELKEGKDFAVLRKKEETKNV